MSTFAQRVQLGPFFSTGVIDGAAKLEHYAAGTSTLKNIWSDRAMTTTLAQPFVADADGIFNFFADGLYKLVIKKADDTVLYTLDDWQFIDRTDPTFGEGTVISSASTIAVGPEIFAHISGSTNITAITGTVPFFWAVFDGNLSLVHSASLLCPASINLAVRTGDTVFFLNEGASVWRVASHYQVEGLLIATQDTRTATVDQALTVRSTTSGTPAAGIGTGILIQAESTDEAPADFGQLEFAASDVGASEDTYFQVLLRVAGAALSAAYRFVATSAFRAIFTHANTADRTYTFADRSFLIDVMNTVEVLTAGTSWTVPADVKRVHVEIFGASGGGAGGGEGDNTGVTGNAGSVGGAGGTTSFNAGALSTTGGGAGQHGASGSAGASHGVGSGGTVNRTGGGQSGGIGGAGGAVSGTGNQDGEPGGSGGDGGYVLAYVSVTPGASITYAIGAAGSAGAGGTGTSGIDGGAGIAGQAGVIVLHY